MEFILRLSSVQRSHLPDATASQNTYKPHATFKISNTVLSVWLQDDEQILSGHLLPQTNTKGIHAI